MTGSTISSEICKAFALHYADDCEDAEAGIASFCAERGIEMIDLWHQVCHSKDYQADLVARTCYRILVDVHGLAASAPTAPDAPLTPEQVQRWLDVFQPDFAPYQSDRGYNTVLSGAVASFEGTYLETGNGQLYLSIGHRPEGDAYRVTKHGYVESIAICDASDPQMAEKLADVLNQHIGYGSRQIQSAQALKVVAGGAAH